MLIRRAVAAETGVGGSGVRYEGQVSFVAQLADGCKYRLDAGPATVGGLRNIFAASSPSGLNSEVAKRAFENWIHRLRHGASDVHGYRWWVLSSICLTPMYVDVAVLGEQLADVAYNTSCFPVRPHAIPSDSTGVIYAGP